MTALLVFAFLATQHPWSTRAEFCRALAEVRNDETCEQVEARLGKPDDIWGKDDPEYYASDFAPTVWCYGTNGHLTMPTLGKVMFQGGKVVGTRYPKGEENYPLDFPVSEDTMRRLLRLMYRPPSAAYDPANPLRLIQAANALRPLGKDKALAVIIEYCRVMEENDNEFLSDLIRVLFRPIDANGYFENTHLGAPAIPPPDDLKGFHTYPILLVDDVPFCVSVGFAGGWSEPFPWYIRDNRSKWTIRPNRLRPPDDPFALFDRATALPEWKTLYWSKGEPLDKRSVQRQVWETLTRLTRSVFEPDDINVLANLDINGFDRWRQDFLATHPHWDVGRQVYVRQDGSFSALAKPQRFRHHIFKGIPRLSLDVSLGREDQDFVGYRFKCSETDGPPLPVALLRFVSEGSEREWGWTAIDTAVIDFSKSKTLAQPLHMPRNRADSSSFHCPVGTRIRAIVEFQGKMYLSSVFKV